MATNPSCFAVVLAGVRPSASALLGSTDSSGTSEADLAGGGLRLAGKIGWSKLEV